MSTFITRLDPPSGAGPRLAVKDLIDVAGVPTSAGCPAIADHAAPSEQDAPCLAGARRAGARLVGKANLYELAFGASGTNPWYGTPVNPLDPTRIPGGSSSGSAVAVATGEADIALGTDTGGSVRIPSACCGTVGLKTTHGRVSLEGIWPLAPSLDTVGPMARDVAGMVAGMALLEPGFAPSSLTAPVVVGRIRAGASPAVEGAVDAALAAAEFAVLELDVPGFGAAQRANGTILIGEAWRCDHHLLGRRDRMSDEVARRIELGGTITGDALSAARGARETWIEELTDLFSRVQLLALPTLLDLPPRLDRPDDIGLTALTGPFNLAGLPALALPIPGDGSLPVSLQLVGPANAEEVVVAAGAMVEAALRR